MSNLVYNNDKVIEVTEDSYPEILRLLANAKNKEEYEVYSLLSKEFFAKYQPISMEKHPF